MDTDTAIVFAGPSLPDSARAQARLAADYRGPAAQGDVLRAARLRPSAIVLIDGYFEHVPAVYHKELLWALEQGIPVYGAASIGALRAAELASFGMIGVGEIYQAFADGTLTADDEVAVAHAPAETQYRLLSEPLVNIRWTLAAAVKAGIIGQPSGDRLVEAAIDTFYPERHFAGLLAHDDALNDREKAELAAWLKTGRIDQKQRDALACLDLVAADETRSDRRAADPFFFRHTDAFERLWREVSNRIHEDPEDIGAGDERLRRLASASPEIYAALKARAAADVLALHFDRGLKHPLSKAALAEEVSAFRAAHGISDPEALQRWIAARNIDIDTLSMRLDEKARIARAFRMIEHDVSRRILDILEISDHERSGAHP